jgi:hypothetical protein
MIKFLSTHDIQLFTFERKPLGSNISTNKCVHFYTNQSIENGQVLVELANSWNKNLAPKYFTHF